MPTIERLEKEDQFLTKFLEETETAIDELGGRSPFECGVTNLESRLNLTLLRSEIAMHRQTLRLLIDAYECIEELKQEVNKNGENV